MKTRVCNICHNELPLSPEFFTNKVVRGVNVRQYTCRECRKGYIRDHYLKNKKKYSVKSAEGRIRQREWYNELKNGLSCEICGESRPWVLDFHHKDGMKDGKDKTIAFMARSRSRAKILAEISKCMILCSNCHRDLHYKMSLDE